jgi:hydrogenase-4 component F
MGYVLILFPLLMAGIAAIITSNKIRPYILPFTAAPHLLMTILVLMNQKSAYINSWLILDPPGKIVLLLISTLYLICSIYAVPYLIYRKERDNRIFCICLNSFLGALTLVTWSYHLGLMWVAIEAATLITAPLIYFNHSQLSIEAMWKYLLIGSVGIALALLGTFFLAYSSLHAGLEATLLYTTLIQDAPNLSKVWFHAAFAILLIGYGTKMGLAPMHTWKPDAYGESPGVVGAIFASCTTSCAFLAFLRIYHIGYAAGEHSYMSNQLIFMGLLSMSVAAIFMIRQRDIKRMLAYSSIEHMGILVLGLGIGGPALFGTMLHIITNGLTKGVMFLSAGNIHRAYGTKSALQISGALKTLPVSGALFLSGFFAITGTPLFGPFVSAFAIINGIFTSGKIITGFLFILLLMIIFVGMGATVLNVIQGAVPEQVRKNKTFRDSLSTSLPMLILMGLVVMVGINIPEPLNNLLNDSVRFILGENNFSIK